MKIHQFLPSETRPLARWLKLLTFGRLARKGGPIIRSEGGGRQPSFVEHVGAVSAARPCITNRDRLIHLGMPNLHNFAHDASVGPAKTPIGAGDRKPSCFT